MATFDAPLDLVPGERLNTLDHGSRRLLRCAGVRTDCSGDCCHPNAVFWRRSEQRLPVVSKLRGDSWAQCSAAEYAQENFISANKMVVERRSNMSHQKNGHEDPDPQMRRHKPVGKLTVLPPYLRHFKQTEEGHGRRICRRSDPSDQALCDQ